MLGIVPGGNDLSATYTFASKLEDAGRADLNDISAIKVHSADSSSTKDHSLKKSVKDHLG